jgi:hypothetical protein
MPKNDSEERRQKKIIPHAFGARAVMKFMFAAIIRASHTWRGMAVSEFDRKQLATLREGAQPAIGGAARLEVKTASRSRNYSSSGT